MQTKNKKLVRLQGIGLVEGTEFKEAKVGNIIYFNFGYSAEILKIEPSKTGKTAMVTLKTLHNDEICKRRYGMNTPVPLK